MDESYLCAGIGGATTGGVAPSDFLFADSMSPPRFPLPFFGASGQRSTCAAL